jgi:hypothetical protein
MSKKHQKSKTNGFGALGPEDADRLRSILEHPSEIDPQSLAERIPNEQVALAFIEGIPLGDPGALEFVRTVQQAFPQKEVQKAAKRTLFRLKQKGVEVPGREGESQTVFVAGRPEEAPEPSAFLSPPDGIGGRAVLLMVPRVPAGIDLAMGIVSDEKGLIEFVLGRYSRKKAREMKEVFFQVMPHLIETTVSHAATVLESCYHEGSESPRQAEEYLKIRPWLLQEIPTRNTPPVYDLIPEKPPIEGAMTASRVEKLMGHEWMKSWIITPEDIKPLVEEMQKTEESPILISGGQKSSRKEDLKETFVKEYYTEERKKRLKSRLEEIAYLLRQGGEEEYARLALGAALSLDEKDSGFQANPFLRNLVERTLAYFGGAEPAPGDAKVEERPSGLILPK